MCQKPLALVLTLKNQYIFSEMYNLFKENRVLNAIMISCKIRLRYNQILFLLFIVT